MGKVETDIMNAVQMEASKLGHRLWRNNRGRYEKNGYWVHYGIGNPGGSDLIGFANPGCRFMAVEVKRPGQEPDADQLNFIVNVRRAGGIAFWCDSVEMFRFELKERINNI